VPRHFRKAWDLIGSDLPHLLRAKATAGRAKEWPDARPTTRLEFIHHDRRATGLVKDLQFLVAFESHPLSVRIEHRAVNQAQLGLRRKKASDRAASHRLEREQPPLARVKGLKACAGKGERRGRVLLQLEMTECEQLLCLGAAGFSDASTPQCPEDDS